MAGTANEPAVPSHGIDSLIAKLRDQGVSAGRSEGEKIIADARAKAKQIVDRANDDARKHLVASRKEAEAFQAAGEAAIKTAISEVKHNIETNEFNASAAAQEAEARAAAEAAQREYEEQQKKVKEWEKKREDQ